MNRRKKLLFCLPHQLVHFDGVNARAQINVPLGALYIAAYLRAQSWDGDIDIYDARLSAEFSQLADGRQIFGDSEETMAARIAAAAPDVVGISNMYSSQFERALRLAEIVKQACPRAIVVIGGPHVSVFPDDALTHPDIDYVVMGEGEERMFALLDCLNKGIEPAIQGVLGRPEDKRLLREKAKVKIDFIKDINDLPLPAYDLVDMERYFHLGSQGFYPRSRDWGKRTMSMITSRGCPHRCVFCSVHATVGYRWRPHDQDYLRRHIRLLRDRYGVDFIHFEDDNLTHDPARYDQLLEIMLDQAPPILWDTPNGVRGDTWTLERVRKTKQAGCQYVAVAIESAVQRVIDQVVRKRLDLSQADQFIRWSHAEGLRLMAFYVIGMPGERLDEIRHTLRYALSCYFRYGVWPGVSLAIALPGTPMLDIATEQNLRDPGKPFGVNQLSTQHFGPADIDRLFKSFLRIRMLIFIWRALTSWRDLTYHTRLVFRQRDRAWHEIKRIFSR